MNKQDNAISTMKVIPTALKANVASVFCTTTVTIGGKITELIP